MKKIVYLFSVLLALSFLYSCDKQMADEPDVSLKVAYVDYYTTPVSFNQVVPAVLAVDKPRGGNVTCTDVTQVFGTSFICGDKIDFTNKDQFEAAFPEWLNVKVDGIYISFSIDGCGEIDGVPVKVGAVIVKGSNSASVYYYPDGTTSDSHLAAPGDKYMVSNLTFCFVECDEVLPELVIALKAYLTDGWLVTSDAGSQSNTYQMASLNYVFDVENKFDLFYWGNISSSVYDVGDITVTNDDQNLYVTIDYISSAIPRAITKTFLFVGPAADFIPANYTTFPYIKPEGGVDVLFPIPLTTVSYTIPLSDF